MKKNQLQLLWRALLCGVTFAAMCCITPVLWAQDGDDDDDDDDDVEETTVLDSWETRKAAMEEKMKAEIQSYVVRWTAEFTPTKTSLMIENLVRRRIKDPQLGNFELLRLPGINLKWKEFEVEPTRSLEEIVSDVAAAAEEYANEKVKPEEQKASIRAAAEERYTMAKKDERVSLELRGGRGANALITNQPFISANDEYVVIGNRQIIKEDLSEEDLARFYTDINERVKGDYITNMCGKVDVEYESLLDAYIFNNTAEEFRKEHYVPDITKPTASLKTAKKEFWTPMKGFVNKVRETYIKRYVENDVRTKLPTFMRDNGYVLVDKEDGKGQEWVDQEEKLYREAAAAAAAQSQQQNGMDGPGMGPGMMPPPMPGGGMNGPRR